MSGKTMALVVPFVIWAIFLGGFLAFRAFRANRRRRCWLEFGVRHQLQGLDRDEALPALYGVVRGSIVSLAAEWYGTGKSRRQYTRATAFFSVPMPAGLDVSHEGVGSAVLKANGCQDIGLGDAELDRALHAMARDTSAVRQLFARPAAAEAIRRFADRWGDGRVTERYATLLVAGVPTVQTGLDDLLDAVLGVQQAVEAALTIHLAEDAARDSADQGRPTDATTEVAAGRAGDASTPDSATGEPAEQAISAADDYIARLAADGRVESAGQFTLDRSVAREKMRRFQLASPEHYVLSLVRCAVLRGARSIEMEVDTDDLRLRFDGMPLGLADLEELYGAMFAPGSDVLVRSRRQLALAINAALGLEPQFVRVTSSDGKHSLRLECRPGEEDRYGPCEASDAGTAIHVKARLRDLFKGRRAKLEQLVEQGCRWCKARLSLNGRDLAQGFRMPAAWGVVPFHGADFEGAIGFRPDDTAEAQVHWIVDGIHISSQRLPGLPRGIVVLLDGSACLKLDVSQAEVVRDQAHARVLAAIPDAVLPAYEALAEQRSESGDPPRAWLAELVRSQLLWYGDPAAFRPGGAAERLARLPAFQTLDLEDLTVESLLARLDSGGKVEHAAHTLEALGLPPRTTLKGGRPAADVIWLPWTMESRHRAFLFRLFGDRLVSVDEALLELPRDPALVAAIVE